MPEGYAIFLLVAGVLLWMWGGTYWRPARWLLWPVAAALVFVGTDHLWWRSLGMGGTMMGVNTLPYGDKTRWPARVAVFASYSVPSLWFSLAGWMVSAPLTVGALVLFMLLSRKINAFQWKIWEAEAGLLQALSLILVS